MRPLYMSSWDLKPKSSISTSRIPFEIVIPKKNSIKSIVAFLNTDGGVLLIGVADAGDILGTTADRFDNDDKYLLHVNNRIREYIGLEFVSFINFQLVPVEGQNVLLGQCQPSPAPVFLKTGRDQSFYLRPRQPAFVHQRSADVCYQ